MRIFKAYKYRLYPTEGQETLLAKHFGGSRWIYNYGLSKKIEYYTENAKDLSLFNLFDCITQLRKHKDTSWLKDLSVASLRLALKDLNNAYSKFFKEKRGFPKFRSKHRSSQKAHFPEYNKVRFKDNRLYVAKFREGLKCKFHRTFEGIIKNVTISKTNTGKYFASILVQKEVRNVIKPKPEISKAIGIDLGLTSFLVTSNGEVVDNPRYLRKLANQLSQQQRKLSRKKLGSNNRTRQRLKVAIIHEKIKNQRDDFLHKVTRQLVDENQVDVYCIENLDVEGMRKNRKLAKSINDASWATFVTYLAYKAEWAGKTVLKIGRFEPSSKTCNACGKINNGLTLKDRTWTCSCGITHNRDYLAACNIRDFAFT